MLSVAAVFAKPPKSAHGFVSACSDGSMKFAAIRSNAAAMRCKPMCGRGPPSVDRSEMSRQTQ